MKKYFSLILIIFCAAAVVTSCKKPKNEKNKAQQTIETPVMQMAEAPKNIEPGKVEIPAPAKGSEAENPVALTSPATPTLIKSATNTEVIIDASGSMNAPIGPITKIGAIKSALKNIMAAPIPQEITSRKVAVRTFGTRSPADKIDCTDTSADYAMGKYDAATFDTVIDKITPQGNSPIAFALEEATKEFAGAKENVDNLIVLVVDGLDSCNGNVIAAAERLHRAPINAIIDVIGFDVDQQAQEILKSLAKASDGTFYLARSDVELATALDQAISSNLPYNLRVKVTSGASPLPSVVTVYRANTQAVVEKADAPGIKFFKLGAGTYDIMVEYRTYIGAKKPSKIIKGVEVTATSKTEQAVSFDLGNVNVTTVDQNGRDTKANLYIRKSGADEIIGSLTSVQPPQMLHLAPGIYDIDAESAEEGAPILVAQVKEVEVKTGETVEQLIKFQTGKLSLKAQNVAKQPIPISYRAMKTGTDDAVASGEGPAEGLTVDLAPGHYDIYATWSDPKIKGAPEVKLSNITINGGETLEQLVTIITGTVKLSGKDSAGKYVHTDFSVRKAGETAELTAITSEAVPIEAFLAPGTYDIIATNTTSKIVPLPSVAWNNVTIKEGKSETMEAVFKLGTIKLIGKNAKEQTMPATFTVYRAGTDEPLVTESSEREWVTFNLTPNFYDIKAEDTNARSEPKPSIWFHDVETKEGQTITNEAIFTSGKLKLICRGKNNVVLTCEFNVFSYGSDTALFSGATADEWREFDIPPGKYYMEAGWHDPKEEQFLKKWINITISENEILEEILRF